MKHEISIPKPCHENWDQMKAEEQGRHCLSCSKTVIDFTNWHQDDILHFLQSKKKEPICGRFYTEQVQALPKKQVLLDSVMQSPWSIIRKIAAIIVISFALIQPGTSNAQTIMGKPAAPQNTTPVSSTVTGEPALAPVSDTTRTPQVIQADTTKPKPQIMGMIRMPDHQVKPTKTKPSKLKK